MLGKALARALAGATLGGRWVVEGLLGVGGMGVVLAATDGPDGAPVVAKVIAPQLARAQWAAFVKASRREAEALRRLSDRRPPSPYVVRFFDEGEVEVPIRQVQGVGDDEAIPIRYLILEYVDGGPHGTTLHDRIHRSLAETGKGFSPARARRILRHVARALGDIHEERLIHRDLKPTNVLVAGPPGEEVAKVTDFGIVRAQGDAAQGGVVAVSIGYSAPEQYLPTHAEVGTQSDVFSFGALAYEVLTGCALFPQEAQASLGAARRSHRHSLLDAPTVHPAYQHAVEQVQAIDRVIAQATWPHADGRPQDVRELWRVLDAQLAAVEQVTAPTSQALEPTYPTGGEPASARGAVDEGSVREERWQWRVRGVDQGLRAVTDVAFGEDGRALAVGVAGVRFWDGSAWLEIPLPHALPRDAFTCVARLDPDRYVLGGPKGVLAFLTRGSWQVLRGNDPTIEYTALWGNERGELVAAGRRLGRSAVVWAARGGEWLPPKKVPGVRALWSLATQSGSTVLGAGDALPRVVNSESGEADLLVGALVSVHTTTGELRDLRPVDGEMPRLSSVATSRFGEAVLAGAGGFAARVGFGARGVEIRPERVETRHDLTHARFDASSQVWAVAAGRIVARSIADDGRPVWRRLWWGAGDGPTLLRVHASGDRLLAFSSEGLVVEGRAAPSGRSRRSERPAPR